MATKKTTAKTVAKKASAAKPTKTPRTDYKAGARVKVTRRNGQELAGRVVEVFVKATGAFIKVNYGTKQTPMVGDFRPSVVRGY